jgi:hypothetical protein
MKRHLLAILALTLAALLFGCSSDDTPTSPGGGGGGVVENDPSFANVVQEIFNRRGCTNSSCHGQATQAGLDLRAGTARGELVNVQATQEPGQTRVIPGDAQNSYLVIKLEDRQSVGGSMPVTGAPLDSIDLANIRNWIDQGAKDN